MNSVNQVLIQAIDGDITELKVDAILTSGNTFMKLGGRHSVAGRVLDKTNISSNLISSGFIFIPETIPFKLFHGGSKTRFHGPSTHIPPNNFVELKELTNLD